MIERCQDFWEGVVGLAEGREDPAARAHLDSCPACDKKLAQLRQILRLGGMRYYDAPGDLISSVKGMMPAPERRVAPLIRSTLAWSGARTVAEEFQLIVGVGDEQLRLMFVRSGSGWE